MLKVIRYGRLRVSDSIEEFRSILPAGHHLSLPSLRWWDGDKTPTHHKSPLLSLKLSSHSFLDSSIKNDLSATAVYTIKTTDASTTVKRCRDHEQEDYIKVAQIKWPGVVSREAREEDHNSFLVRMKGHRWSNGQSFLKPGSHSDSSRKFTIPDYSHSMKWKRYGTSYWCTTSAVRGPIAILDLSDGPEPITLTVYETLHDKYDPQALSTYNGVSLLLLDYLIVTALLAVTDVRAWMLLEKVKDYRHGAKPGDTAPGYLPDHPYAMASASEMSLTSLATAASSSTGFHQSLESYSSSDQHSVGSIAVEEWSKDYWAFLHGMKPAPSAAESDQDPGTPTTIRPPHIPPVPPLPLQSVKSLTGTTTSMTSHHGLSHPLDQPPTPRVQPLLRSPLGLEEGKSPPSSERQPNVSKPAHSISRSESHRRPLPKPPGQSELRRIRSSVQLIVRSPTGNTRRLRTLPATPSSIKSSAEEPRTSNEPRPSIVEGNSNSHLQVYARSPLLTKASQEDFNKWVHVLTNPGRTLPPAPLLDSVVFDLPPPTYTRLAK